MKKKAILGCVVYLAAAILTVQNLSAKISILSPLGFHDHEPTSFKQIHQSAGVQFGINGVSPSGADIDAKFISFPYHIAYGLLDKLEVGGGWGLLWVDRREKPSRFGIGDFTVAAKYRLFEANRAERVAGLESEFGLTFPTASFEKGLGTGGLGILFGWGLVLPLDPARVHFGMGYKLNMENSDDVKVGSVFSYDAGLQFPLKKFKKELNLTAELKGFNHSRNKVRGEKVGDSPDELYLSPGANWKFHNELRFAGSFLIGLTTDSSDIGLNLELQF